MLFQNIVDFFNRCATFDDHPWLRIIRKIHGDFIQCMDINQNSIRWHQSRPRMTRSRRTDVQVMHAGEVYDLVQVIDVLWVNGIFRLAMYGTTPVFPSLLAVMLYVRWDFFDSCCADLFYNALCHI